MNIFIMFKKDFKQFFFTPFGYVVFTLFTLISGLIFYTLLASYVSKYIQFTAVLPSYKINVNDYIVSPLFFNYAVLFLILVPVITIQAYPSEKQGNTFDLLVMSRLSTFRFVISKFLSTGIFLCLLLLVTVIYPLILAKNGTPDPGPIYSGYFGLLLMGLSFTALGLFISSFSRSKITASILTFGSIMFLWFLGWVGDSFRNPELSALFRNLSLIEHYYSFGKGIIDTRDIIYYISIIAFFLFLNYQVLLCYPYTTTTRGSGLGFKQREILFSVLILLILLEINILSSFHFTLWDLTRGKRLSLSTQSIQIIEKVEEPLEVIMFFTEETPGYFEVRNILEEFTRYNPRIKLFIHDPDKEIEKAREYDIRVYGTTVFKQGNKVEKTYHKNEMGLINVLFRFVISERLKIYVLTGYGEHSISDLTKAGIHQFMTIFSEEGYDIERLDLNSVTEIPGDAGVAVICGSRRNYSPEAAAVVMNYFRSGGNLLLCLDPPPAPNHNWFLEEFGIERGDDIVIDPKNSL
ncbi:MAG TPA: hypothetical protein ENN73_04320, partial [Firmicutes bacterium]|nr:hypothetical protein [Bacillota bacterium]